MVIKLKIMIDFRFLDFLLILSKGNYFILVFYATLVIQGNKTLIFI
jgi:hypothetical protein